MRALSRRDVLSTFLGAAFASVACKRTPMAARYDGALYGQGFARGHRLREADKAAELRLAGQSAPITGKHRVIVIGAGPAGLSTCWRLGRGGLAMGTDVRCLELEDVVGGTARGGASDVTRYPWGAHYVPIPSTRARALIELLTEMGVVEGHDERGAPIVAEQVLCRAPEERLFYRGSWFPGLFLSAGASASDLADWRKFRLETNKWTRFRDSKGRPAFAIPNALASDDAEVLALDRISMSQWMAARGLRSPRLRWLVDYACRDDYGLSVDDASAWAGLFYFCSRQDDAGQSAELMTWPDGNGALVRHLEGRVSAAISKGLTAFDVTESEQGAFVSALDGSGAVVRLQAERVVIATPRTVSRQLLASLRGPASDDELRAFDVGAWAVANLHLRDRPSSTGVPFAWDNVFYESPSLGYVVATHQTGLDHGPTVWTWYYAITEPGRQAREKLLSASHHDWADVAVSDVTRAHPDLAEHLHRVDVFRWGHAMVRPRVGARAALAKIAPATPQGRVHFAHTDLSGLALFEEANDHGVRAAEEVLSAFSIASPSLR